MNGPGDSQGTNDARPASDHAVALTEEELARQKGEPLPDREVMSLVDPTAAQPVDVDALYPVDPIPKGAA